VGLLFPTLIAAVSVLAEGQLAQLVGLQSRQAYLEQTIENHRLVKYLNAQSEPVHGVLMIGDRRTFYLDVPYWSDVSLKSLQALAQAPTADAARAYLRQRGFSHVLINRADLDWYTPYDPEHRVATWLSRFDATRGGYLEVVATNESATLYRVVGEERAEAAAEPSALTSSR
jgi:hypothetical protein